MLKRIKKIQQVGAFRKTLGGVGTYDLQKFNLFYGRNTYGKTTFKDILLSIGADDPSILLRRKSIPSDTTLSQEVEMTHLDGSSEKNINFKQGVWIDNVFKDKILAFDNDFVHRNILLGDDITRSNRENLTNFILGEEGVRLSIEIGSLKQKLQTAKNRLAKPEYVGSVTNEKLIDDFINLKVVESKNDLVGQLETKKGELRNIEESESIKKLPDIKNTGSTFGGSFEILVNKINSFLGKSLIDVTKEVEVLIKDHISNHVSGEDREGWIRQGYKSHLIDNICPFCGQDIKPAENLIKAYSSFFNDRYEAFAAEASSEAERFLLEIDRILPDTYSIALDFYNVINKYGKFNKSFALEIDLNSLRECESIFTEVLRVERSILRHKIEQKNRQPHILIDEYVISIDFNKSYKKLEDESIRLLGPFEKTLKDAQIWKKQFESMKPNELIEQKLKVRTYVENLERKIARIDQSDACKIYEESRKIILDYDRDIKAQQALLETQQSEYLRVYFRHLNGIYKDLGSRNFELSCVPDNTGHKKVYSLRVSFHGERLLSSDIALLMSESDKRSLAFSVFLTKLRQIQNRADYIIALDDPIVSFDDNRISQTVDIVKGMISEVRQIFFLTHYSSAVKKFIDTRTEGQYIEFIPDGHGTTLGLLNKDKFVLSDQERAFEKIYSFINKASSEDISRDCRPFMENYLKVIFRKGIRDKAIVFGDFASMLKELRDNGLLDEFTYSKLDSYREGFNPDHHSFIGNSNPEDIRTYASGMLDFLYQI